MRHLMSPLDFSVEELDRLMDLAGDIEAHPDKYAHACDGKKLATLFYEPSTRTRLSHEAAMLNLGGSIMGFSSADSSSASKGESVSDTIRTISCYADICAMRHPKEGAPMVACRHSSIPVINAGDGGHQHPTQTLTDLLTIRSLKGRLDHMTIGLCGDLKFGRTVHSLIHALVRYEGIRFVLISPEELRLPSYIREDVLDQKGVPYEEVVRLEDALPNLDLLYMTRVHLQKMLQGQRQLWRPLLTGTIHPGQGQQILMPPIYPFHLAHGGVGQGVNGRFKQVEAWAISGQGKCIPFVAAV